MKTFFSGQDLRRLLEDARLGNKDSVEQICRGLQPAVIKMCRAFFPEQLQAKVGESDLVQEAMLGASENIATLEGNGEADLLAWVRVIVENKARDLRRKFQLAEKRKITRERSLSQQSSSSLGNLLEDSSVSPLEKIISVEQAQFLQQLVYQLPSHYQEIVQLRHREGLSFPAIANRLGRSEPSVKNIYVRAMTQLENLIQGDGSD